MIHWIMRLNRLTIVHLAQDSMCLARINANHRKAAPARLIIQPVRHSSCLEDDTNTLRQVLAQGTQEDVRIRRRLERCHNVTAIIPKTNCRFILRNIKANKISFHHNSPFSDAATMHRQRARMINYSE